MAISIGVVVGLHTLCLLLICIRPNYRWCLVQVGVIGEWCPQPQQVDDITINSKFLLGYMQEKIWSKLKRELIGTSLLVN